MQTKVKSPKVLIPTKPCAIRLLPKEQWANAATKAAKIFPGNAPALQQLKMMHPDVVMPPEHIVALTTKYWSAGKVSLTVGFLDNPPADLRKRILSHMNAWADYGDISFVETSTDPQVRIARVNTGDMAGYWSYLGTDILSIDPSQPTLNLDSFTMNTQDSEFYRVVRHETGHTLGFPHEHMREEIVNRIDPDKAKAYFLQNDGWGPQEVVNQVLTPLDQSALIIGSPPDPNSIMCYWLPAEIMKDSVAVAGGTDIDQSDGDFAARLYPKATAPSSPASAPKKSVKKIAIKPSKRGPKKKLKKRSRALSR
ncbi:MAG: peptidase M12 [Bacteroidetes bacterium]|nr:MAG: peptidase M12 [Bacteroidota bacterium]